MSELMNVHFLSSDIRTCFFYLNDIDLQNCKPEKCGIKINFGEGHDKSTYGSISFTPISEVPNKCIGITPLFASRLDLKENETVLVTYCDACPINTLQIIPIREEDYIILLRCKTILETYLLSQVGVVAEGQTLPLYVFSNISIDVEVGKLDSGVRFGKLEKFTEITVLHPSEKQYFIKPEEEAARKSGSHLNLMISQLNRILKKNGSSQDRFSKEERENTILKNLLNNCNNQNNLEYKIQPSFMLNNKIEKKIQNKFIIVSNYPDFNETLGPHCIKILAKVEKVQNEKPKQTKFENNSDTDVNDDNSKENMSVIMYVISFNNGNNMTAFCPPHIMKKLNMYVGSKIIITKIKEPLNNLVLECTKQKDFFCKEYFWESMADIRRSTKETILNNIKFNYKLNTLIVGGPGSGKTFLLTDIAKEFSEEFFFCKLIRCKALRGKKIDTLLKFWNENLRECCRYEPSILILDDLHALTYVDDEEGEFNKIYSNRVVDLTSECLENFQGKYNITVIATSNDISQLSSMVSTHGPRLFQNVHTILEINATERNVLLKSILSRDSRILENSVDFDKITNSTNSYTIQDLRDLVDKAIFNCLLRNESLGDFLSMTQEDFDSALSELVPLSLRGVKLKENVGKNWEDVGGMTETKKILTEVFSWPTRYPALLESCPLRLQRGVLLYGAPGTGKTLLAGALANHCGLNFISVKGPEVLSKYVGASEEGVRNLFIQAQKTRPCLLFFDEFDSLAPKRGHDSTGVTDRVVNQLLTQLDGVEALSGVWVLAATSRPDLIDPALLRPGRLDKMVFCGVPERADRCAILEVLSRNLPKAEDVDLSEISTKSDGYTGADLQAVLYNAQMLAIKERKHELEKGAELKVDQNHLLAALAETKPSLSPAEIIRYEKIYERFINSKKKNFVENYRGVQKVTLA